jgi:hypothetical protein
MPAKISFTPIGTSISRNAFKSVVRSLLKEHSTGVSVHYESVIHSEPEMYSYHTLMGLRNMVRHDKAVFTRYPMLNALLPMCDDDELSVRLFQLLHCARQLLFIGPSYSYELSIPVVGRKQYITRFDILGWYDAKSKLVEVAL